MPHPRGSAGRGRRRPRWPLMAAWAVSVAILLVIALVPRTAAHAYGALLLAGSAGSLIVVQVYARLLRRDGSRPADRGSPRIPESTQCRGNEEGR